MNRKINCFILAELLHICWKRERRLRNLKKIEQLWTIFLLQWTEFPPNKGHLRYKTITSQNVFPEAQEFFYFVEKLCSILKIFTFLYFKRSHDLPNLWCHDEYKYMRQGAILNISFEQQLISQQTWLVDRYKQMQ